jgi:Zn-dependent M28 family amino/carboxypeptidase
MKELVEALCSDRCAGRAAGTPGGGVARALVESAFAAAGCSPILQPVAGCGGANVLARLPGDLDRWVLVAAHYDHEGTRGRDVYRGADDNAAAVAILVDVARALKQDPPRGRGVILAAFDAEELPHFGTESMGSQYFVDHPLVPLDTIDMMVCMDLVGHALGPVGLPEEVRQTVFALGAERSDGTSGHVDALARETPGVVVRRVDAEAIPPLSDYYAFWEEGKPFLFLSCGRSAVYHTPQDTVDKLDFAKMQATARWLERFVRETCARSEPRVEGRPHRRDDLSTLRTLADLAGALEGSLPMASVARESARALARLCTPDGRLPQARRDQMLALTAMLERGLS